jgi:hypothetical protein
VISVAALRACSGYGSRGTASRSGPVAEPRTRSTSPRGRGRGGDGAFDRTPDSSGGYRPTCCWCRHTGDLVGNGLSWRRACPRALSCEPKPEAAPGDSSSSRHALRTCGAGDGPLGSAQRTPRRRRDGLTASRSRFGCFRSPSRTSPPSRASIQLRSLQSAARGARGGSSA